MRYENSDFRIVESEKGFLVEKQIFKWTIFGLRKEWIHFISYSGLSEQPFYFETFDSALENMLKEIKWDIIFDYENYGKWRDKV